MLVTNPTATQWQLLSENCFDNPGDMTHLNQFPYGNMKASAQGLRSFLQHGPARVWLIEEEGQIIGFLNFGSVIRHHQNSFGLAIGHQFTGKGYAQKALQEFIARRGEFEITDINGYCHPDNTAIQRVMLNCGMKQAEQYRDPHHPSNKYFLPLGD